MQATPADFNLQVFAFFSSGFDVVVVDEPVLVCLQQPVAAVNARLAGRDKL
jgi:hypothetical protein